MSTQTLNRWGATTTIVTAHLFVAGAIALIVVPDGGLANPVAPTLYYLGLILVVPTYLTIYAAQARSAGKLGFAGFVMSILGSIMYSGPIFVLMAGTSGVATIRAKVFPRSAGLFLAIGSSLWLFAFYFPIPFLLSIANLLSGIGFISFTPEVPSLYVVNLLVYLNFQ